MTRCEQIRPALYRIIEQEADPGEAIEVAGHLADCTACKILLARKRRLAKMLDAEWGEVPVGEDFVTAVMETLPEGPPPPRRRAAKRGLKLAGLAGALGLLGQLAHQIRFVEPSTSIVAFPSADPTAAAGSLHALGEWAAAAVTTLATVVRGAPLDLAARGPALVLGSVLLGATVCAVAVASVVAVAATSWVGARRS